MSKRIIAKRLSKGLLFTFLISSVLTFFAIQIYHSKDAGSLEGNQGIFIMILASIFWNLILTISSLTIFLNLYDSIRHKLWISILTYFLLPILVTTLFFITSDFQEMWDSFFIITGLYFLTQTYCFIKFRQTDSAEITADQKNYFEA
jgi:hypothetical protein